jgi:hypothetical protein
MLISQQDNLCSGNVFPRKDPMKVPRIPLHDFPDVVLHAPESATKGQAEYRAGKGGDLRAADVLTAQLLSAVAVEQISTLLAGQAIELVPIHALESAGVNEIPAALAPCSRAVLGCR